MSTPVQLSHRAALYRAAACLILGIGLLVTVGGIFYGLAKVSVADGASCGTGFTSSYQDNFDLTGTGQDDCAVAESGRQAVTHGLMGAGIGGIVFSLLVFAAAGSVQDFREAPSSPLPPEQQG